MRNAISLNGTWQFQSDPDGHLTVASLSPAQEIRVPLPWQAAFPEMRQYSGYAWYQRHFQVDPSWLEGEILLRFGAVDYWCQVFVNGALVGEHEGGYLPFTMPISMAAKPGDNEIAVRVYDASQEGIQIARWPNFQRDGSQNEPPFDPEEIPHGKQEWYVNVGGIWQDVTLTPVPSRYISHVLLTPNPNTGAVEVKVEFGGEAREAGRAGEGSVQATVRGAEGQSFEATLPVPATDSCEGLVSVPDPHLWSDTDPYLYSATIVLTTPEGQDEVTVRFGFREVSTRDGKILVNGEPIFLLAALDQDLYPDTIYTVPSEEYLRDQFRKAKELGFNCLRCHIKPPDPLYLDLADEMGLLVWTEVPSWRTFYIKGTAHAGQTDLPEVVKRRVETSLDEMVRRDFNHPSIIIWTIVNEDWGTALPLSAEDREWVKRMYDRCKELDPTRLVVDNSPCAHLWGPSFHLKSDLDDFHIYANIPDQARSFAQTIEQYALRPAWSYSNHGDAERRGDEPLVLSEFGNWGLPSLDLLRRGNGKDPAWFDVGPWWSRWEGEAGWPAGADDRLKLLGLDSIWGDYEEFATATQWHQYHAMKFEIEALRRQSSLAGYVVTELADAYWESNGLLDFDRNPKAYHSRFASINAPDVLPIQTERYAYWNDEQPQAHVFLSHYSSEDWNSARLRWSVPRAQMEDSLHTPTVIRGGVGHVALPAASLPNVSETEQVEIRLDLASGAGKTLATNTIDLLVMPAAYREPQLKEQVAVITRHNGARTPAAGAPSTAAELEVAPTSELPPSEDPTPRAIGADGRVGLDLDRTIEALGYRTTGDLGTSSRVAISNYPNARLLEWVREGGDLLYLSRGAGPFFWTQTRGTAYGGNWITTFSWLRSEVYRRLKAPNPLGLPFMHVMPTLTILGLPVEDSAFQKDFLAGLVAGWVRHPAVHTVQFRYGKGRVIMTTFLLEDNLHIDPVATAMFHDLIEYLVSDRCQPELAVK